MLQEKLQEVKAFEGDVVKLKEVSGIGGILETVISNETGKMQTNNEKLQKKKV